MTSGERIQSIAARLDVLSSVERRTGGPLGSVAATAPSEDVDGLRTTDDGFLEIHVVMAQESDVATLERDVLAAVGSDWDHDRVRVVIEDLAARTSPEPVPPARSQGVQ